ncbi:hypothetical protein, partial [Staphylococcus aureus]|uniref:hypothetical protein n=1 Tax=Staphylococcus aureus TaxID=1280 RepID=UPI001F194B3E
MTRVLVIARRGCQELLSGLQRQAGRLIFRSDSYIDTIVSKGFASMATQPAPQIFNPGIPMKREWGTAF